MRRSSRPLVCVCLLGAATLAACGGGSSGGPAATDSSAPVVVAPDGGDDAVGFDFDADTFIPCTGDPRGEHYAPGMSKLGPKGQLTVSLLSSDPGPPIKGNNTWTMLVADGTKAPIAGATLKVLPYMPDHNHGTIVKPVITALAEAGQYKVTPLYLFMPGIWEVTFTVSTPAGAQDAVVFRFCIEQ
jgi:hypothetical protein